MTRIYHIFKLIFLAFIITTLVGCNGSGNNNSIITNNNPNNSGDPDNPESSAIGFLSFTLQNFASESSKSTIDKSYAAKIVMKSESDGESNIYFTLPKDALTNRMLKTTSLYPMITTEDIESIYIGNATTSYTPILPNSHTNPAIDFTRDNLHLIITKPNQAIESGKIFMLHLESSDDANIALTKLELRKSIAGPDISATAIDESTGIINSWITSNISPESIILYPNFYFDGSNESSLPSVLESNQAVNFTRISNSESRLIAYYHITSNNGKTSATYTNLLSAKPEDIHTGFLSFTLQNFASESNKSTIDNSYVAKIVMKSESDGESNIYFVTPKDALTNKMLNLTSLYPIITTEDIESIYIGNADTTYTQILPNSNANPAINFTQDNLHLVITKPNQAIESGQMFMLHLESSDDANITLTKLDLNSDPTSGLNIAKTTIESSTGIITSLISFSQDLSNDLTLYPKFYFNKTSDEDDTTASAAESGLAVTFKTIADKPSTLMTQYHVLSKDGKTSAIYTNLLTHAESSQALIFDFSVDNPDALEFNIDEANKDLVITTPFDNGDITGGLHIAYLGESITVNASPFQDGQIVSFSEFEPVTIEVTAYSGKKQIYYSFTQRQNGLDKTRLYKKFD